MSPIRYDRDFQRTEIEDWDEWIEEQIQEQEAQGAFDNLPGAGKPIHIHRTELNPEYDLAFSRLKNAGIMPAWMELDRDVATLTRDLDDFLERSAAWLEQERDRIIAVRETNDEPETPPPPRPWWNIWQRLLDLFRPDPAIHEPPAGPRTLGELLVLREGMRNQYLERAAVLDRKIASYHNALPEGLGHLQRLRMLPDRAAKRFDARLPTRTLLGDQA
ncbi:MAG TPA: DnaJ family domain-containing protein [Thermomicrobiales bacterium]|nr:DnaJ family domain-containing protein [Thermomicrobiales bacterium]